MFLSRPGYLPVRHILYYWSVIVRLLVGSDTYHSMLYVIDVRCGGEWRYGHGICFNVHKGILVVLHGLDVPRWTCYGGATDNQFPFLYSESESGVSSLNFHLDRERTRFSSTAKPAAPPGQAGSAPPSNPSKTRRPAIYADYYGAKDATFSADWCACFSVYRELKKCIFDA